MANTFTDVIDLIFAQSLMALRNSSVMPRLVRTDWRNEVQQAGNTVSVPLPPTFSVGNVSPSSTPLSPANVTRTTADIPLSYWRQTSMHLTDKEAREIADGARAGDIGAAMSVLADDVDLKVLQLYKEVYGYAGTAGTTPFASDLTELIDAQKVLFDQKCPSEGRAAVLSSAAQAKAMNLRAIQDFKGSDSIINGQIGRVIGFDAYADQQVPTHTTGAATAGTIAIDQSSPSVGDTAIHMDGFSVKASVGDVFTVAGDTQTYVVVTCSDLTGTDADLTVSPPIAVAWSNDAAVTFKSSHVVNLAFHRDAFALAVRPLAPPDGFTGGNIVRTDMDPVTGLGLTLEISRQTNQTVWQWSILYGVKCIRPELACRIAG